MPSNTRGSNDMEITVTCTAVGGGNSTLTPKDPDLYAASTIVFNGNAGFVVGQDYSIYVKRLR
jgi:hypothetical protein